MTTRPIYKANLVASTVNVATDTRINAISGGILVTPASIVTSTDNDKLVTPAALKYLLQNPPTIGDAAPDVGNFTSLTTGSISGSVIASTLEATAYGAIPKIVTAKTLENVFASPPPLGVGRPNNATFSSLVGSSVEGPGLSSISTAIVGTDDTSAITPNTYRTVMSNPPAIGDGNSDAYFDDLHARTGITVSTPVGPASGGLGYGTYSKGDIHVGTTVGGLQKLSVGSDGQYLTADPASVSGVKWASLQTNSLSSGVTTVTPANNSEAINYTITDRALVPSNVASFFASPPNIGSVTANAGTFNTVNIGGSLILINPLSVSQGGLGLNVLAKGDMPIGASGVYLRLPMGIDGQILKVDPLTATGLKWVFPPKAADSSNAQEITVALPKGYLDMASPVRTGDYTFLFSYLRAKSADATSDIVLSNAVVTLNTIGANALTQSNSLDGTVSSSGTAVTGTSTAFTSEFLVGDVLYASDVGRVIMSITDDSHLTVSSAFLTNLSDSMYSRGGPAPYARYYLYSAGSSLYLSTRSTFAGDAIVDIGYASRQLPYFVSMDSTGKPMDFQDTSIILHDGYLATSDPLYQNASSYKIGPSSARSSDDAEDIYVQDTTIISTGSTGANGLEPTSSITGTAAVLGNTITGTSSAYLTDLKVGDYVGLSGSDAGGRIIRVDSNASATLDRCPNGNPYVEFAPVGNVMYGNEAPMFGQTCAVFNASYTDYLQVKGLPYLGGSWTMECFCNPYGMRNYNSIFGSAYTSYFDLYFDSNGTLQFRGSVDSTSITNVSGVSSINYIANRWMHVALVFDGYTYTCYVNGTLCFTTSNQYRLNPLCYQGGNLRIGASSTASSYAFNGLIDEVRISNVARYVANFTPTVGAFVNDSNTVALCHFDSGAPVNGYNLSGPAHRSEAVLLPGSTKTITWKGYNNTMLVSNNPAPKYGTSCVRLFGSTGSYMTMNATVPRSSAWTIEFWMNTVSPIGGANFNACKSMFTNTLNWFVDAASFVYFGGNTYAGTMGTAPSTSGTGVWFHIALYFDGTYFKYAVNGVETVMNSTTSTVDWSGIVNLMFGYGDYALDNFRISNIARYNGNFTPPISTFVTDANTLILNTFDGTAASTLPMNDDQSTISIKSVDSVYWYTATTTPTSSSPVLFGSKSLTASNTYATCSTGYCYYGPWTAEIFFNGLAGGVDFSMISVGTYVSAQRATGFTISGYGGGLRATINMGGTQTQLSGGSITAAGWHHVALVYNPSVGYSLFFDGALVTTNTTKLPVPPDSFRTIVVGSTGGFESTSTTGVYDEFRLSKVARYSATYVVPGVAFTSDADTLVLQHFENDNLNLSEDKSNIISPVSLALVGGAQYQSSISKYGSAMYTNGGFAALGGLNTVLPNPSNMQRWTVEFFFYADTGAMTILMGTIGSANTGGIMLTKNASENIVAYIGNSNTWNIVNASASTNTVTANSWNHIALTYSMPYYYLCVNGTVKSLATTYTYVQTSAFQNIVFGTNGSATYNMYIDEFRVSSIARYTTTYTSPASEFTTDSATIYLNNMTAPSASKWTSSAYISNGNVRFGKSSLYCDRNGRFSEVTLPSSLTSNWSTDFWVSPIDNSGSSYSTIVCTSDGKYVKLDVDHASSNKLKLSFGSGSSWSTSASSTNSMALGSWNHIAIAYVAGTTTFNVYMNGALEITSIASSPTIVGLLVGIGYGDPPNTGFYGYFNEFRVSNATRFTATYDPSALGVLTSDGQTVALAHFDYPLLGSTYIRDDLVAASDPSGTSTNMVPATWAIASGNSRANVLYNWDYYLNGNRSVRTNGWGSGWLTLSLNTVAVSSYTVEFWVYVTGVSSDGGLVCSNVSQSAWYLQYTKSTGALAFNTRESGSWVSTSCGTLSGQTWTHVAITYNTIGGYAVYIGGTRTATIATSTNWSSYFNGIRLGTNWQVVTDRIDAAFDSFRLHGAIAYTSTFTPGNFAASSSSSELTTTTFYGTNDAVFDVQQGEVVTVANATYPSPWTAATLSSTYSKFGNASLAQSNTLAPLLLLERMGNSWTIEHFFFFTGYNGNDATFVNTTSGRLKAWCPQGNTMWLTLLDMAGSTIYNSSTAYVIPTGKWTHFMLQYTGSRYSLAIDGVELIGVNSVVSVDPYVINELTFTNPNMYFDELRISKISRYSLPFTPSTDAFSTDSDTIRLLHLNYKGTEQPMYSDTIVNSSGTLVKIPLPKKAPLYLYIVQHRVRPCYILSSRNMAAGDSPPNVPSGYGRVRQLPYVFFTKSNGDLYNVSWSGRQATFFEDAPEIDRQNNAYQANVNSPQIQVLDFKALGYVSKLVTIKVDKVAGNSTAKFGPDGFYNFMTFNLMNSGANTSSETHTVPLNSSMTTTMTISGTVALNMFIEGFYVTDI